MKLPSVKEKVPSEDYEQECVIQFMDNTYPGLLCYAIPNGGFRHVATAMKLKRTGVRAGIPDLHVPAFNLWIEMKRVKGGVLSKVQKEQIAYLESVGHTVIIGKGYLDAKRQIIEFMQTIN